jgi:hypothetical protein
MTERVDQTLAARPPAQPIYGTQSTYGTQPALATEDTPGLRTAPIVDFAPVLGALRTVWAFQECRSCAATSDWPPHAHRTRSRDDRAVRDRRNRRILDHDSVLGHRTHRLVKPGTHHPASAT